MGSLRERILNTRLNAGQIAMFYLGQEGFLLKYADTYLLVDGYLTDFVDRNASGEVEWKRLYDTPIDPSELDFVDYVFCSHPHADHADPDTIRGICEASEKAVFLGPESVLEVYRAAGVPADRMKKLSCDQKIELCNRICVTAIPAAHEELHPTGEKGQFVEVGYLIECEGIRLFHSGDCCMYEGLEERIMECDVLLLPINGRDHYRRYVQDIIGNFDCREAITLAKRTNAGMLIPMHFDLYEVNELNPAVFVDWQRRLAPELPYHIFVPGERYIFAKN